MAKKPRIKRTKLKKPKKPERGKKKNFAKNSPIPFPILGTESLELKAYEHIIRGMGMLMLAQEIKKSSSKPTNKPTNKPKKEEPENV